MKLKVSVLILTVCMIVSGCARDNTDTHTEITEHRRTVFAMDTVMDLKVYSENEDVLDKAEQCIYETEHLLKRSDEKSEVYAINESESINVSEETSYIISTALDTAEKTDGTFDITIAPVMDLWGFYGQSFYVPTEDEISQVLALTDYTALNINGTVLSKPQSVKIDLGGIAKGYTSDRVTQLIRENGIASAVVSLGGNVQTVGKKPSGEDWKIGIQDPYSSGDYIGGVRVSDKAVITSGAYQRYFEENGRRYHHIINPKTGKPSESGLSSVTIVSESGIKADALSTSLFVLGLEKGAECWRESGDFEVIFADENGGIYITEGLEDCFDSKREYTVIRR